MIDYVIFVPALQKLYPSVVRTVGYVAYDKDDNIVEYDKAAVEAEALLGAA
jgi:hypothetical protein